MFIFSEPGLMRCTDLDHSKLTEAKLGHQPHEDDIEGVLDVGIHQLFLLGAFRAHI